MCSEMGGRKTLPVKEAATGTSSGCAPAERKGRKQLKTKRKLLAQANTTISTFGKNPHGNVWCTCKLQMDINAASLSGENTTTTIASWTRGQAVITLYLFLTWGSGQASPTGPESGTGVFFSPGHTNTPTAPSQPSQRSVPENIHLAQALPRVSTSMQALPFPSGKPSLRLRSPRASHTHSCCFPSGARTSTLSRASLQTKGGRNRLQLIDFSTMF